MTRQPTPINILDDLMPLGNGAAAIRQALLWDYDQLGADADAVRQHAVEIKLSERRASDAIVDAGRHLIAVKERLQHGQWEDWLSVEFKMSDRTARNMMSVARQFDGKTETVSVLGPSVLYLLAGDSVPEPAREAVIDLAKTGQTVTKAQAQTIIDQHKPPKPAAAPAPAITSVDIQLPAQYAALYARCQSFSDGRYAVWYNNAQGLYNADQFSDYDSMIRWLDARQAPAPAIVAADARPLPQWVTAEPAPDLQTDGDRPLPAWVDDRIDSADAVTVRDVELAAQAAATNLPALTAATMANILRPLTAEFYDDGSDYWRTNAARDMRLNASARDGAFWRRCIATLDHSAYRQHEHWTTGLLRQALEMLADEMPATPLTPPVSPPIAVPLKPAPDDRIGRARRLIAGYQATISTFDEYGELIGAHLETLPAKRELEKLIKHLRREIDSATPN